MVALLVGGDVPTAIRLGVAMVALQASIGILNDVVDAPRDGGRVPPKPIPAGFVSLRAARVAVAVTAVIGLLAAAGSGLGLVLLALVVLAIGYGYDLGAKGTAWSWVPFAVGIPILPIFGAVGAGPTPSWAVQLIPPAMLAGAALAIANARADMEVDRAAGTESIATVLGSGRSWWLATACFGGVIAAVSWTTVGPDVPHPVDGTALLVLAAGAVAVVVGAVIGWSASPLWRERAWELQAVAYAVLAVGWLAAVSARP